MFNDGAGALVVSLVLPVLQNQWNVSQEEKTILTMCIFIGFALGSFSGGLISDKYGRRKPIIIIVFLSFVFELSSAFVTNFHFLITLRFLYGINIGVIVPLYGSYVAEIVPLKLRGKVFPILGSCFTLGELFTCGLAFIFLNNLTSGNWRMMLGK